MFFCFVTQYLKQWKTCTQKPPGRVMVTIHCGVKPYCWGTCTYCVHFIHLYKLADIVSTPSFTINIIIDIIWHYQLWHEHLNYQMISNVFMVITTISQYYTHISCLEFNMNICPNHVIIMYFHTVHAYACICIPCFFFFCKKTSHRQIKKHT